MSTIKRNYILSWNDSDNKNQTTKRKIAVIAHLHYEELVSKCFEYIIKIPNEIDIYITVSSDATKEVVMRKISELNLNNCKIIMKENRGRDISSLLVACKEITLKYEYLCFLHDKKSSHMMNVDVGEAFMNNIWENMVKSGQYIYNIINCFEENSDLGVLAPPVPFNSEYLGVFENPWTSNYYNVVELAEKLGIGCSIDYDDPPITIGTAFWCRTDALWDLLSYNFQYNDFPEEPMSTDGTLGHAIERIFMYAAKNRGYYTSNVMNIDYAQVRLEQIEDIFTKSIKVIKRDKLLFDSNSIEKCNVATEEVVEFCRNRAYTYIYGAGTYGRYCASVLRNNGIEVNGLIVTNKIEDSIDGFKIIEIGEIKHLPIDCSIVVAMNRLYQSEVKAILEDNNYKNIIYIP